MARTTQKKDVEETTTERTPNAAKAKAFDELIKNVSKKFESDTGQVIAKLGDRPMDVEVTSTGSLVLDSILGGGVPKGRLIEIYGPEASGKTSVALTIVGNVQKKGGNAVFIDLENALDPRYARKLGVDVENLAVSQPDHAEQALQLVFDLTRSGVVDVIVVDSIASLVPKAELEGDMEQQTIGLLARLMSKALRGLVSAANRTQTTIVFINQTRDNIGGFSPFGTPQTTPGGKAMKFYASQRIEVKRKGQVKEGKDIIGTEVKLKVVKNKIAPPFGEGTTVLTFGRGINRAAEMIEEGKKYSSVIAMPNNRTYVAASTGEVFGKSRVEALERLENDEDLLNMLTAQLNEVLTKMIFEDAPAALVQEEDEEAEEAELNDDELAEV